MGDMNDDALATYLETLARDDCFRVEAVLKEAAHEVTEVVYFSGSNGGELGPFIRKRINDEAGMGSAYATIFAVQRLGKRFKHLPHIYDVHVRDNELIVVMEYVSGRTLHDEVYENNATIVLAQRIFPPLCDGVSELHEDFVPPIIHRDLKPSNVIIGNGQLTIIDFGIARSFRDDAYVDTAPFGTRAYAPPEQFGYGQTDQRSDIYALGMILYYLLTEKNPAAEDISLGFPALACSPALRQVVMRATAFDPAARYQTAADLKAAFLEAILPANVGASHASGVANEVGSVTPAPPASLPGREDGERFGSLSSASGSEVFSGASIDGDLVGAGRASASEVLGLIWDGVVAFVWAVFIFASFVAVFSPVESTQIYPGWFRVLMFPCMFGLFVSAIAYALMDKRWLRRRIPFMADQTYGRSLILSAKMLGVAAAILLLLVFIIMVTNSFA